MNELETKLAELAKDMDDVRGELGKVIELAKEGSATNVNVVAIRARIHYLLWSVIAIEE